MNKKPSFLERLTGALQEDDDSFNDEKEKEETVESTEESKEDLGPIETIKSEPNLKNSAPPKSKIKKITLPPEEKKAEEQDEWLPESEGQLTIDVYQTPADIVIKSTIAGVSPEDLDITITNDMVTIKGKREKDEEIQNDNYYYQECYWGAFSRSVILPVDVETEKAEAVMKNGILTIKLPKIEKITTKKIKVIGS